MSWINPAGGAWDVASNWSTGSVPTSADDVTIDTASAITISIQSGDNISVNSVTTGASDTLSISGGSLTVSAASSLDGPLAMTGGSLTASGSGASLTAHSDTTISAANLFANSGGTLSLPKLTSYSTSGSAIGASGAGSLVDLSSLANLTCSGSLSIGATSGGEINLNSLANLQGSGNPDLVSFTDTGGSKIVDGSLKRLDAIDVILDGTDQHVADSWTQCTNGWWEVSGGAYTLPAMTDVDGTGLEVNSGGRLALPAVTNFVAARRDCFIQGPGSILDMSALKTESGDLALIVEQGAEVKLNSLTSITNLAVTETGGSKIIDGNLTSLSHSYFTLDGSDAQVAASWTSFTNGWLTITGGSYNLSGITDFDSSNASVTNGGRLALSGLTGINTDSSSISGLTASGAGSTLDLSALTAVSPTARVIFNATDGGRILLAGLTDLSSNYPYRVQMTDTGGGAIVDSSLAHLSGVQVTTDGSDAHLADAWTSFVSGQMTVTGGAVVLPNVVDADGAELSATNGGTLTLPALTSFDTGTPFYSGAFEANGSGSTLNLPGLTNVTEQTGRGWVLSAVSGGAINLPAMTSLAGTASRHLVITFSGNGTIADGNLTSLSYADVTFNGAGVQPGAAWTQLLQGHLWIDGSSETFASLTNLDGTSVDVYGGGRLALPALTAFNCDGSFFDVRDAGSVLDMSALTSVAGQGFWTVGATDGGELKLTGLHSLSPTLPTGQITIDDFNGSAILDPNLSTLHGVQVLTDGTDAHLGDAWTSFTNGSFNLAETGSISHSLSSEGDLTLPNLVDIAGSSFEARDGGALTLPNVTDAEASYFSALDGGSLTLPALTQASTAVGMNADGTGSTLDFPALASITFANQNSIIAANGAQIKLPALSVINGSSGRLSIVDTNHSTVVLPRTLTDLNGVSFTLDGTDSQVASALTTLVNGGITLIGGFCALPNLTDLDGSSLYVQNGASLILPSLSNYTSDGASFVVSGAGSVLDASGLDNALLSGG